jgi:hypothetical protein
VFIYGWVVGGFGLNISEIALYVIIGKNNAHAN